MNPMESAWKQNGLPRPLLTGEAASSEAMMTERLLGQRPEHCLLGEDGGADGLKAVVFVVQDLQMRVRHPADDFLPPGDVFLY